MSLVASEWPGVRVFHRLGLERAVRIALVISLVAAWAIMVLDIRPDLLHPTAVTQDTSNYYAAGLRLNVGHPLYALSPGDREVILEPPLWTVPLLSPPTVGALWRPIALLPGDIAMTGWWLGGLLVFSTLVGWLALRLSLRAVPVLFLLAFSSAWVAWGGNVNTYLTVILAGVWIAHRRGNSVLAGVLAAIAASLKLTPLFLLVWLVLCGGRRAVVAFAAALLVIGVVTLVTAGPDNVIAYLAVMRDTSTIGATDYSLAGTLRHLGAPQAIAWASTPLLIAAGAGAVWLLRRRPGAAFAVAVAVVVFGSPVVYPYSIALMVAALVPWVEGSRATATRLIGGRRPLAAPAAMAHPGPTLGS